MAQHVCKVFRLATKFYPFKRAFSISLSKSLGVPTISPSISGKKLIPEPLYVINDRPFLGKLFIFATVSPERQSTTTKPFSGTSMLIVFKVKSPRNSVNHPKKKTQIQPMLQLFVKQLKLNSPHTTKELVQAVL